MSRFDVIPAIDLRGGNVVRLLRGDFAHETIYHTDPPALAVEMAAQGATRLHVVDLDGAREGKPAQRDLVRDMAAASGLDIQVGGGIRCLETVAAYLDGDGAARWVILGTAALRDPDMVRTACARWPGRIIVGIDARKGKVAVEGWLDESEATPASVGLALAGAGVSAIVYTDIARDGTGDGPNVAATAQLAREVGIPIIASGGVADVSHLRALAAVRHAGVCGVVVGRAILSGRLPVADALAESVV